MDNTLSFLREGYEYIPNRAKRYNRNMFETRLLGGKRFVCMTGREAAEVFYDESKFARHGAAPQRVLKTLFGEKGVQTLDNKAHRNRKELFMSLMTAERLNDISIIVKEEWERSVAKWKTMDKVVLYEEVKKLLTKTACIWAGVPFDNDEDEKRADQLSAMYEAGGAVGPRYWKGKADRKKGEAWVQGFIKAVRSGDLEVPEGAALYKISFHRDLNGQLLRSDIAAVELINILRPIVAISVYIAFCALALYEHPEAKEKLQNGTEEDFRMFVQEVRRYYPFFPAAIAKVREDFLWNGHHFRKGSPVLLDIYGTNRDPKLWEEPDEFKPARFKDWDGNPFDFIPQGGGDHYKNHRCPGEWLTIDVMQASLDFLVHQIDYTVPEQNLRYSMTQMPSTPKSGFVLTNVKDTR
jgi:fatty-acid peroxygenase